MFLRNINIYFHLNTLYYSFKESHTAAGQLASIRPEPILGFSVGGTEHSCAVGALSELQSGAGCWWKQCLSELQLPTAAIAASTTGNNSSQFHISTYSWKLPQQAKEPYDQRLTSESRTNECDTVKLPPLKSLSLQTQNSFLNLFFHVFYLVKYSPPFLEAKYFL